MRDMTVRGLCTYWSQQVSFVEDKKCHRFSVVSVVVPRVPLVPEDAHKARNEAMDILNELLVRVGEGDRGAFSELFTRTSRNVFAVVRAVLVSVELSEDTCQEVYLQVWNTADRFDSSRGSAMAWLLTIAKRRAVDHVRLEESHRRRQTRFAATSHVIDHDVVAEAAAKLFETDDLMRHLRSLSLLQLTAVRLAYFDGLPYAEVARILNVPLPTVKSRIRDGVLKLRLEMMPLAQGLAGLHPPSMKT